MSRWRVEMMGGLRACLGERVVDRFPTQKTAALLAFLALNPRAHSREVLADTFWPDADPDSQRHSLRLALSRLRQLLGPHHPIEAGRLSVRLDSSRFTTDVAEMESAVARSDGRSARRLYAPLLPGHYDDWVMEEQARLEALLEELPAEDFAPLPDTVPQGFGRLYGRDRDKAAIHAALHEGQAVTLTAPGGMGKTRLAAAVAKEHGRALWVSLADVSNPRQVPHGLRAALQLPVPAPGFPVEDMVARELAEVAPVLVVLDNLEQLIGEELSSFVERLLQVPGVCVLATSRRCLGLAQEVEHPISPLAEEDAAALFEARARRAHPGLSASEEAIRSLAMRLGGIPLALELAAARAGVQGLAQIESSSWTEEADFGEALGIPKRHRSLATVLRESLALLPAKARSAFARLGVFRGGFDAAGAQQVAGASLATLDALRRWALLLPEELADGTLRFRMPEPLRDLAIGSSGDAKFAHARYFTEWVEANRADELPPPPRRFGQRIALQERERDNVTAALETCRESQDPGHRELGQRIIAAYWTHWFLRNEGSEMEAWATAMLSGPGERANPFIQASARLSFALAMRERGARDAWASEVQAALATLLTGPRDRNLAFAYHLRGFSLADLGRWEESEAAYLEAEALWQELGDLRNYSITRHNRAMLALEVGDLSRAESLVGEALDLFQEHQSTYVSIGNATVGAIRKAKGDLVGAAAALAEASRIHRELGYVRGWAQNERDLVLCLHALGKLAEARERADVALAAFRRVGDRHGEATTLAAIARLTGEQWHADEARGILTRHKIPAVGDLLESL